MVPRSPPWENVAMRLTEEERERRRQVMRNYSRRLDLWNLFNFS